MSSFFVSSATQGTLRKLLLVEGDSATIPSNSLIVNSEVVIDDDDNEFVQLWLIVPSISTPDTSSTSSNHGQTIYSQTVVYEDNDEAELARSFRDSVESEVNKSLEEWESEDYEY